MRKVDNGGETEGRTIGGKKKIMMEKVATTQLPVECQTRPTATPALMPKQNNLHKSMRNNLLR